MKQLSWILIALAIVAVYGFGNEIDKSTNGIPAKITEYPHVASLRFYNIHFCSGNIIHYRFILTTAECVSPVIEDRSLKDHFTVVTATTYLHSGGNIHKVDKVWRHENYDPASCFNTSPHNIGVIRLTRPFPYGPMQQLILLPSVDMAMYDDITIAAWGVLDLEGHRPDLRKVNAKIMLAEACKNSYPSLPINSYNFCILSNATKFSHCDNGSGLIRNFDKTIVGLVSRGRNLVLCALDYPYLYVSIKPYVSWIKDKLRTKYD